MAKIRADKKRTERFQNRIRRSMGRNETILLNHKGMGRSNPPQKHMKTIIFEYDIKTKVEIKTIKTEGIIVGYYCGETGVQYQVSYFINGEKKVAYLYPEEIVGIKEENELGFPNY